MANIVRQILYLLAIAIVTVSLKVAVQPAMAVELDAFTGHWESDQALCQLHKHERKGGSYLVIEPAADTSEDLAILRSGDYENGGGECRLRHDEVISQRRIRLDALCTYGELKDIPGQFEVGLVYDEKHVSLKEEGTGETLYFSRCSADPDHWNKGEKERLLQEEIAILEQTRNQFRWLPRAYCKNLYSRQSDFVSSGDCAKKVAACMGASGNEDQDCPQFSRCEYWEKGRRKSSALCGMAAKLNDEAGNFFWVWQNGNVVNLTYNAETRETRWANRLADEVTEDNKTCYVITKTGEKFCTWPLLENTRGTGLNH